jgi:hypothetical protein
MPIAGRRLALSLLAVAAIPAAGCALPGGPLGDSPVQNPMFVGLPDSQFVFDQTVDVVDDYFTIDREETVKFTGELITEGQISTFPLAGATYFEPWRGDAADPVQRFEGTLQSVRRTANVRVIPTGDGYLVDVQVYKELEDVRRPEYATASAASFRHDGAIRRYSDPVPGQPVNAGWIPQGRDLALEQRMLCDLQNRLRSPAVPVGTLPPP